MWLSQSTSPLDWARRHICRVMTYRLIMWLVLITLVDLQPQRDEETGAAPSICCHDTVKHVAAGLQSRPAEQGPPLGLVCERLSGSAAAGLVTSCPTQRVVASCYCHDSGCVSSCQPGRPRSLPVPPNPTSRAPETTSGACTESQAWLNQNFFLSPSGCEGLVPASYLILLFFRILSKYSIKAFNFAMSRRFLRLGPSLVASATRCIADTFAAQSRTDPFTALFEYTPVHWANMVSSFVERAGAAKRPLSVVSVGASGEVEGVMLNEDWTTPTPLAYNKLGPEWRSTRAIFKELHTRYNDKHSSSSLVPQECLHTLYFTCVAPTVRGQVCFAYHHTGCGWCPTRKLFLL